MTVTAMNERKSVYIAILIAIVVGGIGGASTIIGPWYYALAKPSWQPPDWLFGPVWTTVYVRTAIAGVKAWRRGDDIQRRHYLGALLLNCVLNMLWRAIFFTAQRPDIALIEVVPLWLSVLLLAALPWKYSRASSWLLLPYLLWVAFAAYLNQTIVRLNAPF